jgi:hypothetical protein
MNTKVDFKVDGNYARVILSNNIFNEKDIDSCDYDHVRCVTQAHMCLAMIANTYNIDINDIEVNITEPKKGYEVKDIKEMASYVKDFVGKYSF